MERTSRLSERKAKRNPWNVSLLKKRAVGEFSMGGSFSVTMFLQFRQVQKLFPTMNKIKKPEHNIYVILCTSSQLMLISENNLFLNPISGGKDKKANWSWASCWRCHRASRHSAEQMGAASHRRDFKLHKTFLLSPLQNHIKLWLTERPHMEINPHRKVHLTQKATLNNYHSESVYKGSMCFGGQKESP